MKRRHEPVCGGGFDNFLSDKNGLRIAGFLRIP